MTQLLSLPKACSRALHLACTAAPRVDPAAAPLDAPGVRAWLAPDQVGELLAHGASMGTLAEYADRLLAAWVQAQRDAPAPSPEKVTDPLIEALPVDRLREPQLRLLTQTLAGLKARRIVMAEASTGIGKSWVLALLAETKRKEGGSAMIAAPTLAVANQIAQAFIDLELQPPHVLMGRSQFADPERLQRTLAGDLDLPADQKAALAEWNGHPLDTSSLSALARTGSELRWLIHDLAALAPDFPIETVRYEEREVAPAQLAHRDDAEAAQVCITTHSMVAVDMRLRMLGRAVLPEKDWLLIDEAHQFEEFVDSAFSAGLSVHGARLALIEAKTHGDIPKGLDAAVDRVLDGLHDARQVFQGSGTLAFRIEAATPSQSASLRALLQHLEALRRDMERIDRALPSLNFAAFLLAMKKLDSQARGRVRLSPKQRYPTIVVGPRGLGAPFSDLWGRTQASVLCSATLYIDTAEHGRSAGLIAGRLHVPAERLEEVPPVIAPWVTSTPTLYLPSTTAAPALIPPRNTEDDPVPEAEQAAYFDALAAQVRMATADAVGGTLVLATSYSAIRALAARIEHSRLLVQTRDASVASLRQRFIAEHRAGLRPIWLATGPAWTGLDLRDDCKPADDTLLTDLVITRLPVQASGGITLGSNRSLSIARLDTAMRFRQGLGRLIRTEGLQHRRIWILDGRLCSDQKDHLYLTAPSRRVLEAYPQQERIHHAQ